eukprot:scaffold5411_cov115-Isochrysis_galbana.AAC.2
MHLTSIETPTRACRWRCAQCSLACRGACVMAAARRRRITRVVGAARGSGGTPPRPGAGRARMGGI